MSIARLQTALAALPYALREPILGYARSVDAAAPDIAREANVELTQSIRDQLIVAAGIRKFYALCASAYWAIDNAGALLETRDIASVRVGRTDYSRGGTMHRGLRSALTDFDAIVGEYHLQTATEGSLVELLTQLADER